MSEIVCTKEKRRRSDFCSF